MLVSALSYGNCTIKMPYCKAEIELAGVINIIAMGTASSASPDANRFVPSKRCMA